MTDSVSPDPDGTQATSPQASTSRATAAATTDAYFSTGLSPGKTVHLIGPGQVGRAFLRQLQERDVRVVAVSDRSATVFRREGLPIAAIEAFKAGGKQLQSWPLAEVIPSELAIRLVAADVVVDATPSSVAGTDQAIARARAALQTGASLALCSKNGLAAAAADWLQPATRARIGVNAVLGGTGAQLLRELDELQADCQELALVGNVTTTAIVTAVEAGATVAEGIAEAQKLGFLEPDASLDLDGSDAAVKLLCVWSAVFGSTFCKSPTLRSVQLQDVRELDATLLRERVARGATTRLVARGSRSGNDLRVGFEEAELGSPWAAPSDRVVYGYELSGGLRVHTGLGVGYERTAEALWVDVDALLAEVQS